jgi:hypothetical protein
MRRRSRLLLQQDRYGRVGMGQKWRASFNVEFEMEEGQPEGLAQIILNRELAKLKTGMEIGENNWRTGVKPGSVRVDIISHKPQN